jgi:hypothetical protein
MFQRQLDARLDAVHALLEVFPKLKACCGQPRVTAGVGPSLDPAMMFILIEERRGIAANKIVQIDQRPTVGPLLVQAFFLCLSPETFKCSARHWSLRSQVRRLLTEGRGCCRHQQYEKNQQLEERHSFAPAPTPMACGRREILPARARRRQAANEGFFFTHWHGCDTDERAGRFNVRIWPLADVESPDRACPLSGQSGRLLLPVSRD